MLITGYFCDISAEFFDPVKISAKIPLEILRKFDLPVEQAHQ
jgi:hypothetical protein